MNGKKRMNPSEHEGGTEEDEEMGWGEDSPESILNFDSEYEEEKTKKKRNSLEKLEGNPKKAVVNTKMKVKQLAIKPKNKLKEKIQPSMKKAKTKMPQEIPLEKKEEMNQSQVQMKSAAEFFANNKNIAGFDNPGKSLYTTVREFIENSLDAAEYMNILPEIFLTLEEMSQGTLNAMKGIELRERVNEKLYLDYEGDKQRIKNKDVKEKTVFVLGPSTMNTLNVNENGVGVEEEITLTPSQGKSGNREEKKSGIMYYKVTVKDNGCGMPHEEIPNMLGRVLAGTKYGVKQTRGKFGLGAKMALIWSKMSTGYPIEIRTAQPGTGYVSYCRLDIDIYKNMPQILAHEKLENPEEWHGSEISVIIEGNWSTYRAKILQYLRQLAVITPYAYLEFRFVAEKADKSFGIRYARRSEAMPPVAMEVKYHPSSVNLLLMKKLLSDSADKKHSLLTHLIEQFSCIDKKHATQIISELGEGFSTKMKVSDLSDDQITRLFQLFKLVKFSPPEGNCLSPAGEYNLRLGIIKELNPEMVATYQEKTRVFEGHPFIVEAAVSLGGRTVNPGINVYRFANRIPLLFEAGADVVTRTAQRKINWSLYKIKQNIDKIGVFVSLVSTKIPFKGTGKEYIGDDIEEIASAVKHALQQCCLQLKFKLTKQAEIRSRQERRLNLTRYIPTVSKAIYAVLQKIYPDSTSTFSSPNSSKTLTTTLPKPSMDPMLFHVSSPMTLELLQHHLRDHSLTETLLINKLTEYIEKADVDQALDYIATQSTTSHQFLYHLTSSDEHHDVQTWTHPLYSLRLLL